MTLEDLRVTLKTILKRLIPANIRRKIKQEIAPVYEGPIEYQISYSQKERFFNKRVLVTGGSGAIGSAICFRLAMEGAYVGVCGRDAKKINIIINNIGKNGGKAVPIIMDVNDEASVKKGINEFCADDTKIDILINNAGGSARGESKSFGEQDFSVVRQIIDTNLNGTMLYTRYALEHMCLTNGRIISMSSVVGLQGKCGMTDYAASKAGIIGFTRSLAVELGEKDFTVNCISPGWVNQTVFDRGKELPKGNVNCMGHGASTDEVASLVAFLCSEEAGYITGQNIVIDGGRSLGLWGDN